MLAKLRHELSAFAPGFVLAAAGDVR